MPRLFVDYQDALKTIDALEIFTLYAAQSKRLANPEQAEKEVKTLLKTLTVLEQLRASTESSRKVDKIVVKRAIQLMNKVYTNCLSDAERKAFSKDFKKATTVLKKSS
ncbi:MAG: hypothetical protein Q8L98_07525 [Chlamydiales bacterium]|nr:hypothetical protein [Chlamydiales bacterium]